MQATKPSREHWRRHVRAWKTSGLSSTAYAAQAGINANTLTWWRWRLDKDAKAKKRLGKRPKAGAAASRGAKAARRAPERVPTFELVELPKSTAMPETSVRDLELHVGAVQLRVPVGFDGETLARVLALLEPAQ